MYRETTSDIEVSVEPFFLPERSEPDENRWFWAYRVTISNQSERQVKLLSRYWRIVDARGKVEEVRGPGVVGEQPELAPGDSYQYTSGCPLTTPSGIMQGHYTMTDGRGRTFDVAIPAFSLDLPEDRRGGRRQLN
jgi:ApaG protein